MKRFKQIALTGLITLIALFVGLNSYTFYNYHFVWDDFEKCVMKTQWERGNQSHSDAFWNQLEIIESVCNVQTNPEHQKEIISEWEISNKQMMNGMKRSIERLKEFNNETLHD